jgi:hypothetical protein
VIKFFNPSVAKVFSKKVLGSLYTWGAVPFTTDSNLAANRSNESSPAKISGRGLQVLNTVVNIDNLLVWGLFFSLCLIKPYLD